MLLLLLGCLPETVSTFNTCEVDLVSVEPTEATVGSEVTLTARPLSEDWDTAVRVGGIDAEVLSVTREDCGACDTCQAEQGCACTEDCDACDVECRTDCLETVVFAVPQLAPGEHAVTLFNAHGGSASLDLVVVDGDTGQD